MSLESILPAKMSHTAVVSCTPNQSIHETARLMKKHNVGCVIVQEGGVIKGLVTDRDILIRGMAKEPAISPADPISLVMSTPVTTISSHSGVQEAMTLMKNAKVRRLPVVNSSKNVIGVLTFSDLYQLLVNEMEDLKSIISAQTGFEFGQKVA